MSENIWACRTQELAKATGGQIMAEVFNEFYRVGTDTRENLEGKLFIALKGDQFDGHNYVTKAVELKARVILIHEWRAEWKPLLTRATFVRVTDTLQALQALARFWRKKCAFKVIAITGSNGKTSTKEFAYSIFKDNIPTYASAGSFNNHWGVPRSILEAGPEHKVVILEMGMNHAGEIWRLCQIAEPDIVAVTMVGRAHVGELGSIANVAQAKEEIYTASPKAIQIFNMDNEWTMRMQSRSTASQVKFSAFRNDTDVHFRAQRMNWEGLDLIGQIKGVPGQCWVHVLGRQNTVNLMCASALAVAAGLKPDVIWKGLASIHNAAWGRNQILSLKNGARVLFDAYNANPDSMQALLKNLYEMDLQGRKFLVAGDMRELGTFSEQAHEEAGERAGSVGFEGVWYVGEHAKAFARGLEKSGKPKAFDASPGFDGAIAEKFYASLATGDLVAVKASRGVQLEKVVESWPLQTPLGKKP